MTPAEQERLDMLAEEAAEIIQIICKIKRHGVDSYHPADPSMSNKDLLKEELIDFSTILIQMCKEGDIDDWPENKEVYDARWAKKLRYTHHQEAL